MAASAEEALNDLFSKLQDIRATDVANDIKKVISRGITEETIIGKTKEFSQRPLNPKEAYNVAVEMLISALEPLLMQREINSKLELFSSSPVSVVWSEDFVERSLIEPEKLIGSDSQPLVENTDALKDDIHQLMKLMKEEK